MAFVPLQYDQGQLVKVSAAASTTITKGGTLVDNGSGYLTNGASSTAVDVPFVAMETVTTSATDGDLVLCIRTRGGVIFEADTDANPAQTDVGTYADLASVSTVNPDASTNDLFYIEAIVGALADRKVRGYFTEGVPNS